MFMRDLEKIYKAVANRRRLSVIKLLKSKKEASVGDISEHLKLSFRSTSRHLAILKSVDIIDRNQKGLLVFYHLNPDYHPAIKHLLTLV